MKRNEKVIYRMFQESDRPALNEIVRKTWNYDRFCTPETASTLASFYLKSCLANQTYTQVALLNGKPIGIIMVRDNRNYKRSLLQYIESFFSVCSLLIHKERRYVSRIFSHVEKINKELLNQSTFNYDGELVFFAIDESSRGKGIGKTLFQNALTYMHSRNISHFFLFTDTSCNYGFYDHQGMTQRQKQTYCFDINGQSEKMTFFLYDYGPMSYQNH